jgi:hypothetical protein
MAWDRISSMDLAVGDGVLRHQGPDEFRSMMMVSQFS